MNTEGTPVRSSYQKQTYLSRRGGRFVISGEDEEEEFPADDDELEEFEGADAPALPPACSSEEELRGLRFDAREIFPPLLSAPCLLPVKTHRFRPMLSNAGDVER